MQTYFEANFFTNNRNKLRKSVPNKTPIVITGNGILQRTGDENYKFHQDSNFWYLTGISAPDLILVMLEQETYLIVPTLSFERQTFDGAYNTIQFTQRSGISQVVDTKEGWNKLQAELRKHRRVATLGSPPEHMRRHGLYSTPVRRRLIAQLKRRLPGINITDIRAQLAALRCVKQPAELIALQQAIDITTKTFQDIRQPKVLQTMKYEYELEATISYGFRHRGADGHAFEPVVAAGKNGTTLHHTDNNHSIRSGDLIVIDVGASVEHYAADITRTISNQPLKPRQTAIFQAVKEVQTFALNQLKPGVLPIDYEKKVEAYMGKQLQSLKIITSPTHQNIRRYFPHATSHFLGLDTHDVGDYRKPLQPDMVLTCEPGIYIPEEGIGVRLEDDVLLTATGNRVLSSACPTEAF